MCFDFTPSGHIEGNHIGGGGIGVLGKVLFGNLIYLYREREREKREREKRERREERERERERAESREFAPNEG